MERKWFELDEAKRKCFNKSSWIPLRAAIRHERQGTYGHLGYKEDFFGSGTIAVPVDQKELAQQLRWSDIGLRQHHSGSYENDKYYPADQFRDYRSDLIGLNLVLDQHFDGEFSNVWHLHPDIVTTLKLMREGDSWICPRDGYTEVARLKRESDKPALLEIKAEYLKDYLCARNMGLYITAFYERDTILESAGHITWPDGNAKTEDETGGGWEGRVMPIHEGSGEPYGQGMAVFHVARTDVHEADDTPDISALPSDENVTSSQHTRNFEGRKLFRVIGELWKNEWVEPAQKSPRVRGDKVEADVFFIIDVDGTKVKGDALVHSGKWLWFKPEVIMALAHRRGGSLGFYTRNTGGVACSHGDAVHFGVNSIGYVNVYAKDIGLLPEWQQQIWASHNITPDGGVSEELLASQVRAEPADTQAPETFLRKGIQLINDLSEKKLGFKLFRHHDLVPELLDKVHRFRAVDQAGLFALAKDVARLTADSLDAEAMQKIVTPPKGTKWGSLKSLENLLATRIEPEKARAILTALVGAYDLRLADAHLPSSRIDEAFALLKIARDAQPVFQGQQLLHACVSSLYGIAEALKSW